LAIEEAKGEKLLSDLKEAVVESIEHMEGKRKLPDAKKWIKSF
jgi:hypothetical protein